MMGFMRKHVILLSALTVFLANTASAAGLPAPGSEYHLLFATENLMRTTTSTLYPPDSGRFNGIVAADWQVTSAAFDASLPNMFPWDGVSTIYHAIVSISGDNARDRLSVTGPVYNLHGDELATGHADLFDGFIATPVAYDEYGSLITSNTDVWTGCSSVGVSAGQSCGSWNNVSSGVTGSLGSAQDTNSWLSIGSGKPCNLGSRLYGLSPALTAPLWGDYDGSGTVDGRDFLEWQRYVGIGGDTGIPIPAAFFAARRLLMEISTRQLVSPTSKSGRNTMASHCRWRSRVCQNQVRRCYSPWRFRCSASNGDARRV
jgi:hypothetical protein